MSQSNLALPTQTGFGTTNRTDSWWLAPLAVFLGLSGFVVYSTWAAFQGEHYAWGPYLSPFYSPLLPIPFPSFWPEWLPKSPAFFILWMPAGFRTTCYYYRKAYYRAFFLDPAGCAVGERKGRKYIGERSFPFVLQNAHRYFLLLAVGLIFFLAHDAWKALWFDGEFGIGVGTLVLIANTTLLSLYTFSCHSLRHMIGGKEDCFSCASLGSVKHGTWKMVSYLNLNHQLWAWLSLSMVGFADFYIRMVSMGIWTDFRII